MGSALAFALMLSIPQAEPIALDDLLSFADPARCVPGNGFAAILDQLRELRRGGPAPARIAVDDRYASAFSGGITTARGNNGRVWAGSSLNGSWHGLPVRYIGLNWAPDAREPALELFFLAPPETVSQTLSAQGLIGTDRTARIEANGNGTLMSCDANG